MWRARPRRSILASNAMTAAIVAVLVLAAASAAYLALRARLARTGRNPNPESYLLEEATVVEPIAPGMEGKAELRKRGALPHVMRARATDAGQAFARGAKVRVIDYRDGCCFIESVDEEHLVR
jgi:hypothetical protein